MLAPVPHFAAKTAVITNDALLFQSEIESLNPICAVELRCYCSLKKILAACLDYYHGCCCLSGVDAVKAAYHIGSWKLLLSICLSLIY